MKPDVHTHKHANTQKFVRGGNNKEFTVYISGICQRRKRKGRNGGNVFAEMVLYFMYYNIQHLEQQ